MIRKVFFKTMVGAIIIGAAIASCVEVKDLYDPEYAAKLAEYRAKWVEQFGEIDPNEDWGFGSDEETTGDSAGVVTRGEADTQGNMWGGYVDVPKPLTDEQKSIVTAWFNSNNNPEGIVVNWTDFFLQQVSSNDNAKGMSIFAGKDNTHMNNFNGGDCTENTEIWDGTLSNPEDMNSKIFHSDKIQYIKNTDTSCFGFKSTQSDNPDMIHYNYVIVSGDVIHESLTGMYFLGFDFESTGSTEDKNVSKDGYYSDWIIKITPAIYTNPKRIICEDLGLIGDFDFNDIVFDVTDAGWNSVGVHEAVITVRAAGGTLPIYVGGVNIKEALGFADHIMVNTGAVGGVDGVAPATFRIPWPASNNLKDIEVLVKTEKAICVLDAPVGDAPQKICVPADFVWPSERVNIKTVYTGFPNIEGWERNMSGSSGDGTDQGGTDQGGTDQGGTDQGGTDQGGTDQGGTDQGGGDQGNTGEGGGNTGEGGGNTGEGGNIGNEVVVDLNAVIANGNVIPASYFTSSTKVEIITKAKEKYAYVQFSVGDEYKGGNVADETLDISLFYEGSILEKIKTSGLNVRSEIDKIESITIINY